MSQIDTDRQVCAPRRPVVAERVDSRARIVWIDNLRVALIIMVVAHHAGQAYGPTGGVWPIADAQRAAILGPFFAVNAAFGMGGFFLLAGYFVPGAYDRKRGGLFLRDRLVRLGIPLLLFTALIYGPYAYLATLQETRSPLSFSQFLLEAYLRVDRIHWGHLWFLIHLLLYSAAYGLGRSVAARAPASEHSTRPIPGHGAILGFTLLLATATFLVRIWYPIDCWGHVLLIAPVEWAHLPQYVSLFIVGIVAYRSDWFRRLPARTSWIWLEIGLAATLLRYSYALGADAFLPALSGGGLTWSALAWSVWETLIAVSLAVGVPILFRERLNTSGRLLRVLSGTTYTAYLIHLPIVLGLQIALANAALPPLVKFALVTALGVPLCFLLSAAIQRLPYAQRVL